jgi:hypothetical protein
LTVWKNIWWKARLIHAILSIQNYFQGNNNLLTFKTTTPHLVTLIVLSKVILGS